MTQLAKVAADPPHAKGSAVLTNPETIISTDKNINVKTSGKIEFEVRPLAVTAGGLGMLATWARPNVF